MAEPDGAPDAPDAFDLRCGLRPGDLGAIVALHGTVYAEEHGYDASFEAYVAGPLAAFAGSAAARDRLWIAERAGRLAGCAAIVDAGDDAAQLRWFLVAPDARGCGLGRRLLREAVAFAGRSGYASVFLWTVGGLEAAARLYRAAGFVMVEEKAGRRWGVDLVEERHVLDLQAGA